MVGLRKLLAAVSLAALASAANAGELADRIQAGERDKALALIAGGAEVNAAQGDGATPLLWAVYTVDHELVEKLLAEGADPSAQNRYGAAPLTEAIKLGDEAMVDMLLAAGADPEAANADGQSALMLAAHEGYLSIARKLIARGVDVNRVEAYRGQTALMWAAAEGRADMVKLLLDEGADFSIRAQHTDWPRQMTSEPRAQYRSTGGLTALLYATRGGCLECAKALVEAGADVNQPNPDGVTPLINAIDNFNYDVAAYLLEEGANPHVWDMWGRTALYTAVDMSTYTAARGFGPFGGGGPATASKATALDIIDLLLDAGVDPNVALNQLRPPRGGDRFSDYHLRDGATPLIRAALTFDAPAVEKLIEHGARVDLPNARGVTPLMLAAGFGASFRGLYGRSYNGPDVQQRAIACLELIYAAGGDVNQQVVGSTSLTARAPRFEGRGTHEGQTALHGAAERGWTEVVQWLLDHGADPTIKDSLGRTPADSARAGTGGAAGAAPAPQAEAVAALLEAAATARAG